MVARCFAVQEFPVAFLARQFTLPDDFCPANGNDLPRQKRDSVNEQMKVRRATLLRLQLPQK